MIFPVGYGVGSLLYPTLSTEEQAFWNTYRYGPWNTAQGFGTYYFDWAKSTSDFVESFIQTLNSKNAVANASFIQASLVMATHFYNPNTGNLTLGGQRLASLTFTQNKIQVEDVIYYLDGNNNIVGFSHGGLPEQLYPAPIPVPNLFIQEVPNT